MRWLIAAVLGLCACGGPDAPCAYNGRGYNVGDVWPQGDGCNSCSCTTSGVSCTKRACVDGGVTLTCGASGGCPEGPACGTLCCNAGEKCELQPSPCGHT